MHITRHTVLDDTTYRAGNATTSVFIPDTTESLCLLIISLLFERQMTGLTEAIAKTYLVQLNMMTQHLQPYPPTHPTPPKLSPYKLNPITTTLSLILFTHPTIPFPHLVSYQLWCNQFTSITWTHGIKRGQGESRKPTAHNHIKLKTLKRVLKNI